MLGLMHVVASLVTAMASSDCNHLRSSWNVLLNCTTMEWKSLESHQSLANLSVRSWVNLTTLSITKEFVQGLKSTLAAVIGSVLTHIASVVDWIVDGGIT